MARFAIWHIAVFFAIVIALIVPFRSHILPKSSKWTCAAQGFESYNGTRKVWDLFLVANELDFLEIRLNTLKDVVDHFVILEAPTTFTGIEKPLYLQDNWDRYADFHSQIIHAVIEDKVDNAWSHEYFMRDKMLDVAVSAGIEKGDVIIVSDLDEIPRPEVIAMLRGCEWPNRVTLQTSFHYYSYGLKHWRYWGHPDVTTYRGEETTKPNALRNFYMEINETNQADVWDAGWHCSSCFKTIKQVLDKMEGFSHADSWNTPENRDPRTIIDRIRHGLDIFGRDSETYEPVKKMDAPEYVMKDPVRFRYLLDRTGGDAAFQDVADYLPD